jgi:hypothetical protein
MRTVRGLRGIAVLAALGAMSASCRPDLNQTVSIVSATQILGVRSDPAEAAPKDDVKYTALIVDSLGPLNVPVDWAFCNARKPLAELGPVSRQCLQATGDWFVPLGAGIQAAGALPDIACRQFGPLVPQATGAQPAGRPVDPDQTGGYYQPVRMIVPSRAGDLVGIAETRLSCDITGTPDQLVQFHQHYIANSNPAVDSLTAGTASFSTNDHGESNPVHVGDSLALTATWASCPQPTGGCGDHYCALDETKQSCEADCAKLSGCTGAETYVSLDLNTHNLVTQREGIEAAWFATAGSLEDDRTGRGAADQTSSTTNTWHAPARPTSVRLWVVLRDDRGGTGWAEYTLDVH